MRNRRMGLDTGEGTTDRREKGGQAVLVGWDWASETHDVTVLDEAGMVVDRWVLRHTERELDEALRRLARHGRPDELPVAIERTTGLVVERLLAAGYPVVPIHPNAFHAARSRWGASKAKSDPGDSYKLADYLRTDGHRLRRLRPLDARTRELQALCRMRDDHVAARTAATNQLGALLEAHWPGAKAIFSRLGSEIALRPPVSGSPRGTQGGSQSPAARRSPWPRASGPRGGRPAGWWPLSSRPRGHPASDRGPAALGSLRRGAGDGAACARRCAGSRRACSCRPDPTSPWTLPTVNAPRERRWGGWAPLGTRPQGAALPRGPWFARWPPATHLDGRAGPAGEAPRPIPVQCGAGPTGPRPSPPRRARSHRGSRSPSPIPRARPGLPSHAGLWFTRPCRGPFAGSSLFGPRSGMSLTPVAGPRRVRGGGTKTGRRSGSAPWPSPDAHRGARPPSWRPPPDTRPMRQRMISFFDSPSFVRRST